MADDLRDLLDEAEEAVDMQSDAVEITDFPQTLVTEKIIFVIDILTLRNEDNNACSIVTILKVLKLYLNIKNKISVKPPEYECVLYNIKEIVHYNITTEKSLDEAFISFHNFESAGDDEPLKIDEVFDKIATLVELPDPDCLKKSLPPSRMYHVIWLFGQNLHVPTMQNTNSFDFLMMTPYFALDLLYLHNRKLRNNQCQQISQALRGLNENGKGYFLCESAFNENELFPSFAKFLGNPLIRIPQVEAEYNIVELQRLLEVFKNNNEEE